MRSRITDRSSVLISGVTQTSDELTVDTTGTGGDRRCDGVLCKTYCATSWIASSVYGLFGE